MRGIKEYLSPASLDELVSLLDTNKEKTLILGGGTHLALLGSSSSEVLIDVKKAGLNYIKDEGDYIRIGAATRAADIIKNELLGSYAGGLLPWAAAFIGSTLTQNLVTIGGNLYSLFPWSNLPPALIAVGATVELASSSGTRLVTVKDLVRANPKKYLGKNEVISAVLLPKTSKDLKTSYKSFALTENDYDIVIVTVALQMEGNVCRKARIVIGAAIWPCDSICDAGKILQDKSLDSSVIQEAAEKVASTVKLTADFRTTDEHRVEVIKTLVKRALEDCKV